MTLKELLNYVDEIKPNAFTPETKTVWINEVEGMVHTEVFLLPPSDYVEYKWSYDADTKIFIPNDHTIGIRDKDVMKNMRPGGKLVDLFYNVSLNPSPYDLTAIDSIVIRDWCVDGLVVDDDSFSYTLTEQTVPLHYSGEDIQLMVNPPHSKLYAEYLFARIDYANGEYDKYQNSMQMFNAFYREFMRWYATYYRPADDDGNYNHDWNV